MKRIFAWIFLILTIAESMISYKFASFQIPKEYVLKVFHLHISNDLLLFFVVFVLPYAIFLILWLFPFFYVKDDDNGFLSLSFSFFFTSTLVFAFYLLFQTNILAPNVPPKGVYDKVIIFLYSLDRPQNLYPLQYLILTILSSLSLFKLGKIVAYIVLPIVIGIGYILFNIGQLNPLSLIVSIIISLLGFFIYIIFS